MKVEKAQYENNIQKLILVDDNYNIIEEVLMFINYLYVKGSSINTINTYIYELKFFFEFLSSKSLTFTEVKSYHIQQYMEYICGYGDENIINLKEVPTKSPATINKKMAAVKSIYNYYDKVLNAKSTPDIKAIVARPPSMYKSFLHHVSNKSKTQRSYFKQKVPKKILRRLSKEHIEIFRDGLKSFRDKLIFDLFYESGIRISELLGLYIQDYGIPKDSENVAELNIIRRKENRPDQQKKTGDRIVYIPKELIFEIDNYITTDRPFVKGINNIFISHKGKTRGLGITRYTVNKMFRECSKKTGIKCTPHMLRHTHLTELKEAGYDIAFIQERAGHSSPNSTLLYIHLSDKAKRELYERYVLKRSN